jgi:hypothetical protein
MANFQNDPPCVRAFAAASPKAFPKAIWGTPFVWPPPATRRKSLFGLVWFNMMFGAPRPSPLHRGCCWGTERNKMRHVYPPASDHSRSCCFPRLYFTKPPSSVAHPSATVAIADALRWHILAVSDSAAMTSHLAALFTAGGSPSRARTRRPLFSSPAHRRCSIFCLVGITDRISMTPQSPLNTDCLFVFRNGKRRGNDIANHG